MKTKQAIKRKRGLIIALLSIEVVLFAIGAFIGMRIVREQMASMIGEQVKLSNARYAENLAGVIESSGVQDTSYGSGDWQKMQQAVAGLEMSAGGFACILDANDKVVCHPDLDADPAKNEGSSLLYADLGSHLPGINEVSGTDGRTRVGQSYFLADGVHYIATREIAGTSGHRLLVHQPAAGLVSLSDAMTTPLMLTFVIVAASVLLLTSAGSYVVARRYEHTLEGVNAALEDEVQRRTAKHTAARNALIFGLAKLADSRDPETGAHLERLCAFTEVLAVQLQSEANHAEITDEWVRELRLAAALHDIGKVGVADSALLKPGRLNEQERAEIQRHPQIAADTLLVIYQKMGDDTLIACSVQVALYHHEKWDGSGYPFKLKGDRIPLSARIVAVADVYDALTSKRVYKDAMSHEEAVTIINDGAGKHFDPELVLAFNKIAETFDRIKKQTNEGNTQVLSGLFD